MGSIRKFKCKRCHKNTNDLWASSGGVFEDGTKWSHENIDLCPRCFKITRREVSQTDVVRQMLELKMITDEDLPKFQLDKKWRAEIFAKFQEHKRNEVRKRNNAVKGIGVSPSSLRRKESRKLLGVKGIGKKG